MRSSALLLVKFRIRAVASSRPNAAPTEVFLSSAISTLARGGTDGPERLGEDHLRASTWPKVRPMARAASACPSGTALMPDRIASHTKAEV